MEDEYFQELQGRVEVLEAGTPSGPDFGTNENPHDLYQGLEGRVSEIESVLRQRIGTLTSHPVSGPAARSILDSKFISSLSPLTDDKAAFRQWDAKRSTSSRTREQDTDRPWRR